MHALEYGLFTLGHIIEHDLESTGIAGKDRLWVENIAKMLISLASISHEYDRRTMNPRWGEDENAYRKEGYRGYRMVLADIDKRWAEIMVAKHGPDWPNLSEDEQADEDDDSEE